MKLSVSRTFLESVLSRAVTYASGMNSPTFADDLRLLQRLGATFLGRVAYVWLPVVAEEEHFARAALAARQLKGVLPDAVLQAAVFEAVYPAVGEVPVPSWVFTAFGEKPESRTFSFGDMISPEFRELYEWTRFGQGGFVPDLTLPETQRYFYYRARRYIDSGYEAIHMGQPHLYGGRDAGFAVLEQLLNRIREYARAVAPRGFVLLDAHTHGISRHGRLLFDFHSRPISAQAVAEQPEKLFLQMKGKSMGGIAPSGWSCEALPYLIEIDNWGGYTLPPSQWTDLGKRAGAGRWGWDDIAWFAHQPDHYRQLFLTYAHRWVRLRDRAAFFQVPVRRLLGEAGVPRPAGGDAEGKVWHYAANHPSAACPAGFGDEDAILAAWSEPPPAWLDARPPTGPATTVTADGQDVPDWVSVAGSVQLHLGGTPGHSWCPYSRLQHLGAGRYQLATVVPEPAELAFSFVCGGTFTEVYRRRGLAGGELYAFATREPAQRIRIVFDYGTREGDVLDDRGASLLLPPARSGARAPGMNAGT